MTRDDFCLKSLIRPVIDFPKAGVIFRDITPLYQSPRAMRVIADTFIERYVEADFSHIGAMDARGFLIGSVLAHHSLPMQPTTRPLPPAPLYLPAFLN